MPFVGGMFGFGGGSTPEHVVTSGALAAQAALLDGAATRYALHTGIGALAAQYATVSGAALHPHVSSGALLAGSAALSGAAVMTVMDDPVKLLLHMEADAPFIDDSIYNWTVTTNGSAAKSSAQAKFGTYSLLPGGTSSDYLRVDDQSNLVTQWDFGTEDLTIEFWAWSAGGTGAVITWATPTSEVYLGVNGSFDSLGFNLPGGGSGRTGNSDFPLNQWVFVAATRDSGTWRLYINNTKKYENASSPSVSSSLYNITPRVDIGYYVTYGAFDGYIDELRVTRGTALYTTDTITVPTTAFPDP